MGFLRQLFTIEPVTTPEASAAAYVPLVMVSRALAFLRTLLVARLLGEAGQVAFGLYQPALELINPLVALVMFGAADVAERYVSRVQRDHGHAGLRQWLGRKFLRVGGMGALVLVVLVLLSAWISVGVWGSQQRLLLAVCGVTVLALALYQFVAAVLRGLRAFSAAAGMEILGAVLLLGLSVAAAFFRDARWLVVAYALSVAIPLAAYAWLLWRFLAHVGTEVPAEAGQSDAVADLPHMNRFAAWSLVRLLLVMLFGFLSLWGVRYLGEITPLGEGVSDAALKATAQYSMPYRIAQLLGFLAVTLWASSYGIAARAWSHGRVHRAKVELFRIGRLGIAALTVIAMGLLVTRGVFAWILPTYADAIMTLLPGLLGVFIWYSLVAFLSTFADLSEKPQHGAALWAMAVAVQIGGILLGRNGWMADGGPKEHMLLVSAGGLLAALVLVAPIALCRPLRFTATGVPLVVLGVAAVTLQIPEWVVDGIAVPVMAGAVLFLYLAGLLIRRGDRRAIFRGRRRAVAKIEGL